MMPNSRPLARFAEFEQEVSLSSQLPYWDFTDEAVVLADGSLAVGLRLRGLAIECWDTESINRLTQTLRAMLNSIPDGCEVSFVSEVDSDYRTLISAHDSLKCSNPLINWVSEGRVSALHVDSEANLLLRPNLYAFIYKRFDPKSTQKFGSLRSFFSAPKQFKQRHRDEHESALRELTQACALLEERLETTGLAVTRLTSKEAIDLVYRFLNPKLASDRSAPYLSHEYRHQEFTSDELARAPELTFPTPREQLGQSDLIQGYESFILDGLRHRIITLKILPEYTHSALVSRLSRLPFPHVLHVHVRVPEQSQELATLQAKRRMAHSMSATQGGRASDLESEAKLNSTEELLRELINTGQKIFYFQCAILLRAESLDELDSMTKSVLSTFRELGGAEGLCETVAGLRAWKTVLPFGTTTLLRSKRIKTDNLADFLPLYQPYAGTPEELARPVCLFRGRSGGLVAYDPFNSSLPNYNALVTGSSGSGKSFINNLVLLQYLTQDPSIYIIDIGGSYRKLCEFLGGQYIEITPPRPMEPCLQINPFALPVGQTEPSPQKIKFLLALLESILTDSDSERLPKLDKSVLEERLLALYKTSPSPTFSTLAELFVSSGDERLIQFAKMLYPWTGDRPYGRLLDGQQGISVDSDIVVFDLKGLSSYPDLQSVMLLIITDYILGRVESRDPRTQARRKQILMDECWELLKSPASSSFMEYCVRTLRKTGSGITFITQGLEEIVASPIGSAILSNTATKFILMQRGDLEPIRRILRLNDQEMTLISTLRQVKGRYSEAFLMANEARTIIRAVPTPVEYWLATSDAADAALLTTVRQVFPTFDLPKAIHWLSVHFPTGSQGQKIDPEAINQKGV